MTWLWLDMVSILPWTLNLTVGKYRRSNPFEMVSTLRADVAMVMWQNGEVSATRGGSAHAENFKALWHQNESENEVERWLN